jgi:putative zinc finger/helix-turn-helix YgiT family protein
MSMRHIEQRNEKVIVRGESIEVDAKVAICDNCKHDIVDLELDDASLEYAYDVYRQRHKILTPQQIQAIRENSGLSQRGFGRLLGWGDVTIHRYETGALPDVAHNALLVALQDDETLYRFVERRQDALTPLDRRKARALIDNRLPELAAALVRRGLQQLYDAHPASERGNRAFDLERVGHMIVYFALHGKPSVTKLNKLLWYADFLSFKRLSVSMSGTPYVRLPLGPVPDRYKLLYDEVEQGGFVCDETLLDEFGYTRTDFEPLAPFDEGLFTAEELDVLRAAQEHLADLNASQAAELSHQEQAWIETPETHVIPYAKAMSLSMD